MGSVTKRCARCGEDKPLSTFHKNAATQDGRARWCRECRAQYDAERVASLTPEEREQQRQQHAEGMRQRRAQQTPEEKALAVQAYRAGMRKDKCATCGNPIEGMGVCQPCRAAMTQLGDSPEALRRAAKALGVLQR